MTRRPRKLPFFGGGEDDEPRSPDDDAQRQQAEFAAARKQLSALVRSKITGLERYRQSLGETGSPEIFTLRANWLTGLAEELQACKNNRNHSLFHYVRRTSERKGDVQRVITAARKAAALFERYATRRKPYLRTEAQIALSEVITTLRSLEN